MPPLLPPADEPTAAGENRSEYPNAKTSNPGNPGSRFRSEQFWTQAFLVSFLAFFSARFSSRVLVGFFLVSFFCSRLFIIVPSRDMWLHDHSTIVLHPSPESYPVNRERSIPAWPSSLALTIHGRFTVFRPDSAAVLSRLASQTSHQEPAGTQLRAMPTVPGPT